MITPMALALVIAKSSQSSDIKRPILERALGNNDPFPPPSHLGYMLEVYDNEWALDRANFLVDNALVIKFDELKEKQKEWLLVKEMVANGGLSLEEKQLWVSRGLEVTKEIENIVLLMESAND